MASTLSLEDEVIPKLGRAYDAPEDWHVTVLAPAPVIHLGIVVRYRSCLVVFLGCLVP